ncbi:MAG TPA: glycosyltransferase, partial [Acidimicrobiales bacterium]|nr:glycosyltransferase [Acidimicrobiales bacterium]
MTAHDPGDMLLDLTVVVPYYNPGPVLRATVERAVEVLQGTGISFEVVAVSDGSTDGSEESLEGVHPDVVVRVALPHAGKGNAVRAGLAQNQGRYLGFID